MTTGEIVHLGIQSFLELGSVFVNTMMQGDDDLGVGGVETPSSSTTAEYTCSRIAPDGTMNAAFFLDWTDSHKCAGSDWIVLLILTVLIHAISWWSRWLLWEPMAELRMKGHKGWTTSEKQKFSMTVTSAMFFIIAAIAGWKVFYNKSWLWNPSQWSDDLFVDFTLDGDFKFHYLLYAARFCSDFISIFFEDRRWDTFLSVLTHHVVTVGLVLASANSGCFRIGGVIMFFFDWADPFLLIAKTLKYLSKRPQDNFQNAANIMFGLFAISFFMTHNVMFNFVVYIAFRDFWGTFQSNICCLLLLLLVVLQTYWIALIGKAIYQQVKNGGIVEDVREDEKKRN